MSTYTPDVWVVVRVAHGDDVFERILAGWYGGYVAGDSWKLSSAIETVTEYEDRFEFENASGSLYICYKGAQRMSNYTRSIYASFQQDIEDGNNPDISMEIVDYPIE